MYSIVHSVGCVGCRVGFRRIVNLEIVIEVMTNKEPDQSKKGAFTLHNPTLYTLKKLSTSFKSSRPELIHQSIRTDFLDEGDQT